MTIGGNIVADYIGELRQLIGKRPIIMCDANAILLDTEGRVLLHHRRLNLEIHNLFS